MFNRLRDQDPVFETDFGYWYVSRYDDVVSLLRDTRLTSGRGVPDSLGVTGGPLREIMESWMMALDGPAHRRARALISRAFTPLWLSRCDRRSPTSAEHLVDGLQRSGGGDIVAGLAFALPMEVTRQLFGVDVDTWDAEVVALFDPARRSGEGWVSDMQRLTDFLAGYVPHAGGTGLFSALQAPDDDGNILSEHEQVANSVLLVTAGFETTMSLITNAVRTLLLHPDQLALLRSDWALTAGAVDEVLRYEPPGALDQPVRDQGRSRSAGAVIPAGANVLFSSVAANRDPARYTDPDRFDITRTDSRPVTFGGGVHSCIGSMLARVETELALVALFQRFPSLHLVEPVSARFQSDNPSVRRPESLLVTDSGPA